MRLEQLEFLVEAADSHSITLASHKLHTAQQNISRAIRQLEEELHLELLKRSKKGVTLTPDGEFIYEHAKAALSHICLIEQHKSRPEAINSTLSGTLDILSLPGFYSIIFDIIKLLNQQFPNLSIKRLEQEAAAINASLNDCPQEIIFTAFAEADLNANTDLHNHYQVLLLKTEPLKLIGSINSPLTAYKKIALSKLTNLPLVIYYSDTAQTPLILDILKAHHVTAHNIIKTTTPAFCSDHILNGTAYYFGTTYLLSISDKCHSTTLHCVSLTKNINMSYVLLIRQGPLSPAATVFVETFQTFYHGQFTPLSKPEA